MQNVTWTCTIFAACFGIAALTGGAEAQISSAQQSALRANCRSDFMSHCSGVSPGGKDALVCLQKHVESLSPACQTVVKATMPAPAKPSVAAPVAAPAPAAKAEPAPSPPPATETKVAPAAPPKAAIAHPEKKKVTASAAEKGTAHAPTAAQQSALRSSCRSDFMSHCSGVTPGGKEALSCLERNVARLSPACQTAVRAIAPAPGGPATAAAVAAPPPPRAPKAPLVDAAVMLRACKLDLIRHCRTAEAGEGRKLACLTAHSQHLTIRCRTALKLTAGLR